MKRNFAWLAYVNGRRYSLWAVFPRLSGAADLSLQLKWVTCLSFILLQLQLGLRRLPRGLTAARSNKKKSHKNTGFEKLVIWEKLPRRWDYICWIWIICKNLRRFCNRCQWKNVACHISKQRMLQPSSHYSHSDGEPWGNSGRRQMSCPLPSPQSLQPPPKDAPWGDSGWQSTGYWPQIAEVRIKGMISGSPDSCIFPYIEKGLNSLTWDIWFSLINSHLWCSDYLVFVAKTPKYPPPPLPLRNSLSELSESLCPRLMASVLSTE